MLSAEQSTDEWVSDVPTLQLRAADILTSTAIIATTLREFIFFLATIVIVMVNSYFPKVHQNTDRWKSKFAATNSVLLTIMPVKYFDFSNEGSYFGAMSG